MAMKCKVCAYIYDSNDNKEEDKGKSFEELPDTYKCPSCGAKKRLFTEV